MTTHRDPSGAYERTETAVHRDVPVLSSLDGGDLRSCEAVGFGARCGS